VPAIKPTAKVPSLKVKTIEGNTFDITQNKPENFTLVAVYRGLHCPICKSWLGELKKTQPKLEKIGVDAIALSTDTEERARKTVENWSLSGLPLGYGLTIDTAREWGLAISKAINSDEPAEFSEPGIFLVRPDQTLYASSIQTMPFTRPSFSELAGALEFVLKKDYPARGDA